MRIPGPGSGDHSLERNHSSRLGLEHAQLRKSEFYIPLNYHNPYVSSWNVAVQQALPMQFNTQLSYVGNHGTRMGVGQNINLANALNLGAAGLSAQYRIWENCVGDRGLS